MSIQNTYWTSIVKKILNTIVLIVLIFIILKLAVFYMPFLIAFIISLMMEPAIKKLMEKLNFSRKLSSIIMFIIVFGIILGLLIWGISTIVSEASNLLSGFNEYYENISNKIQRLVKSIDLEKINISNEISQVIQNTIDVLLQRISIYFIFCYKIEIWD